MVAVVLTVGPDHVLWRIGVFFSQLAVVTFGGAYAVLAYMAQEAVQGFGWLSTREMADGLGLAETTPGPLILVTQFVGFLAAFRAPEPFTPLVAGLLGAGLTTWVTFVATLEAGPLRLPAPETASLDGQAAILTIVALVLVFSLKWDVLRVLASCAVGGLLLLILT